MKLIYVFLAITDISKILIDSANVLGFFNVASISHQNVFRPIWKELSLRGHQVTVITPNPIGDKELSNLTEIDVSVGYDTFKKHDFSNLRRDDMSVFQIYRTLIKSSMQATMLEIDTEEVQQILKLPEDYFDLILIEAHVPMMYGIQHKFKAPLIAISSMDISSTFHHLMGNPIHPFLFPEWTSGYVNGEMSFLDKLDSLWITVGFWFLNEFFYLKEDDALARNYFGNDMPYISDMIRNTSLLFLNVNPVFSDRRPYAPNVIPFTIIQTEQTDVISEDLLKILDDTETGVIYFSLGTNVRLNHVQNDLKTEIMKALGELPYNVLCKWDTEDFPGKPENVILKKWFNQQSILAHPNVKVFVTQGGLQSSEQAVSYGVPLVVIPFLGDQPMNAKKLYKHGMSETVYPRTLTREILKNTILKVAGNGRYREKAQEFRKILLDQPQNGLDKIVWWCDYVIKHKGAKHLRSPGGDISLYEYFMVDVFVTISTIIFVTYKILRFLQRIISKSLSCSKTKTLKKNKKI